MGFDAAHVEHIHVTGLYGMTPGRHHLGFDVLWVDLGGSEGIVSENKMVGVSEKEQRLW